MPESSCRDCKSAKVTRIPIASGDYTLSVFCSARRWSGRRPSLVLFERDERTELYERMAAKCPDFESMVD